MISRSISDFGRSYALLISLATASTAQSDFMLSDFESGMGQNALWGYWYHFGDAGSEGNSRVTTMDSITGYWDTSSVGEGFGGSVYSGRMGWVFGDKRPTCGTDCTYDPEVNLATDLREVDSARNLTGATAVTFAAKANQPVKVSFLVLTAGIKDHSHYRQVVDVGTEWKEFTVTLKGSTVFSQPPWGSRVPFDPAQVTHFHWQASKGINPTLASDTLLIDDVRIVGWTPLDPTSLQRITPEVRFGRPARLLALGDARRVSVSLQPRQMRLGGTVHLLDLSGRTLARRNYAPGQRSVEFLAPQVPQGLALVRIVPFQ